MTPERWERVRRLFDVVVGLKPAERSAYLEHECGADTELGVEVERLLAADRSSDGFFAGVSNVGDFLDVQPGQPVFSPQDLVADRFRIVRYIGRGGMGEVYEVEDIELRDRVALKTLLPRYRSDQRQIARFRREVHIARKVKHPNVCRIHDVGTHRVGSSSITFLTMELLAGETLADYLKREGKLKESEAGAIIKQLGAGLQALHDARIVHRDFKPGNVILLRDEIGDLRPVLTDFGLARPADDVSREMSAVTQPGHIVGTPDYMAPEHMAGQKVGTWSDVYSFGLVVCEALTGRHPFRPEPREIAPEDTATPTDRTFSLLPGPVAVVIRRCLSAIPSERPETLAEVVQAISGTERRALNLVEDGSKRDGQSGARGFWTRKRALAAFIVTMLALVITGYRLTGQGMALGGVIGSVQDGLCAQFPGQALFCALPADRDIAFRSLAVTADDESGLAYGKGLSKFIGDSLYRLRSNKGEFCFHVRGDKQEVGVLLVLSGEVRVSAEMVAIDTQLVRVADGQILRWETIERDRDDLHGLHEGLIREFAELVGYELEPAQIELWQAEGPRDTAAFEDYLLGLGLLEEHNYERAGVKFHSALAGRQGGLAFAAAARGLGDANRHLFSQTKDLQWARKAEQA